MVKVRPNSDVLIQWLEQWWPALGLILLIYFAVRFVLRRMGHPPQKLDSLTFARHQIQTSLGCSDKQANKLLVLYSGNAAKAIHEVKTGKALLPGTECSDIAHFGGEAKSFVVDSEGLLLQTQDSQTQRLELTHKALLFLGVVDADQRPDKTGLARADRGHTYAQLYWKEPAGWKRFLLNSTRMDYYDLGEQKQSSAIRNFLVVLEALLQAAPNIESDGSLGTLKSELRAPHYKTVVDFEADSTQKLRNWEFK